MATISKPRTTEAATRLLERYAELEGEIGGIEAVRSAGIAEINGVADKQAQPLLDERNGLRAVLEEWWGKSSADLTEGKRKSVELGGCMIGSREGRPSLGLVGKEDDAVVKLQKQDWAASLLRTKVSLDRVAVFKALSGEHRRSLLRIGFAVVPAPETFFIERTEQGGTLAGAGQ